MRRDTNSFLWGGNHFEQFFFLRIKKWNWNKSRGDFGRHPRASSSRAPWNCFFFPISFFLVVSSSGQGRSSLFSFGDLRPKKQKVYQSVPTLRWCFFAARNLAFWDYKGWGKTLSLLFFFFSGFSYSFIGYQVGKCTRSPVVLGRQLWQTIFSRRKEASRKSQIFSDNLSLECPKNPLICLYYPPWR